MQCPRCRQIVRATRTYTGPLMRGRVQVCVPCEAALIKREPFVEAQERAKQARLQVPLFQ